MRASSLFMLLVTIFASVALPATAQDLGVVLSQPTLSGAPGTTLTFDATLTNQSSSTIYLNGDSFTTTSIGLTLSDNPFNANAPLSLAAGASSGPFAFFTIAIASGLAPGVYSLNNFTILGGPSGSAFNVLGSTNFAVDVAAPVPEPTTLVLVGSGLLGLGITKRMKLGRRSVNYLKCSVDGDIPGGVSQQISPNPIGSEWN